MAQTRLRNLVEILEAQLRQDPAFRVHWERTVLARAVALVVIGYGVKHHLTPSQLAAKPGVRQPPVARLEPGEHTSSLELLQWLARTLGLRSVEVASTGEGALVSTLTPPLGVEVVEDVTAHGSRILLAIG